MSTDQPEIPDEAEQLDDEQFQPEDSLTDRGVDDALDEGYSPPENYSTLTRFGDEETLDERLAEEVPDVTERLERDFDRDAERDPNDPDGDIDEIIENETLYDGEVGDSRSGRLVDPNEGIGDDVDKDLVGDDVGIDGGAASAEEAAVHVVPDDYDAAGYDDDLED